MIDHPPAVTTLETTFGCSTALCDVFAVRAGIPLPEALEHASNMLATALALTGEMVDADPQACRALARAVGLFVEASKTLVDASVHGLDATP